MGGPAPIPVEIRGKVYASAKEAAEALGIDRTSVYHALRKGTQDFVGLKGNAGRPETFHHGFQPKPIKIGGLEFPSIIEAARTLGVSASTMNNFANGQAGPATRTRILQLAVAHADSDPYAFKSDFTRMEDALADGDVEAIRKAWARFYKWMEFLEP